MPSIIHKKPIADELKKDLSPDIADLILGTNEFNPGILNEFWQLLSHIAGNVELAYLRGRDYKCSSCTEVVDKFDDCRAAIARHLESHEINPMGGLDDVEWHEWMIEQLDNLSKKEQN